METVEKWINKRIIIKKVLPLFIFTVILLIVLINLIKLPVNVAGWLVPFEVETNHFIPIDVDSKYSKIAGLDMVQIVYENEKESITVWATTDTGWNNFNNWDEQVKLDDGSTAYYNANDDIQMIGFRMGEVEYAIDYKGNTPLEKKELIKIATSIILTKYA